MSREKLQKPIEILFLIMGAYLAWQAVNFCQGNAPIPGLTEPVNTHTWSWAIQVPFYYLTGMALWVAAGILTMHFGKILARLVAVGTTQLGIEMRESWEEEQRLAKIESNRLKRRELRRKIRQEKSGGDSTGAFIAGAIIGSIFF
jgi:hypothetical protein